MERVNDANVKNAAAESSFVKNLIGEKIFFTDGSKNCSELEWNDHPKFKGVSLKHLISDKETSNKLNIHIVRVAPHCILDSHLHQGVVEIHEVISGNGTLYLDGKEFEYHEGSMCVIPADTIHKVVAGDKGLYLIATFSAA